MRHDASLLAMDGLRARLSRPALRAFATALLLLALTAAGAQATVAAGQDPSERWPSNGLALRTALGLGADHWGMDPCHGTVQIGWLDGLDAGVAAQSTWANDAGAYAAPVRNTSCEIALNPGVEWTWPMLCTVVVHEVGHLDGHDHVDDPDDVMYPTVARILPACADAPEPPPPAPPAGASASPTRRVTTTPKPAGTTTPRRATAARHRTPRRHRRTRSGRPFGQRS